ncbi:hypothetical protein [Exiguobacterium oxidotolerans]|uniref:DUF4303 domain-containing protein n=1 Tax=Exiguobacterium oxidotolerans TaxID=223958 RepID=A0A653II09_9BACL|nr:hypothetical protein [Exiguobacterium oxidotolerans]VWX38665.1 conserved hypothetical protein [Exiguobacterium oxidotolerans]
MFTVEKHLETIKSNLEQQSAVLVNNLREVVGYTFAADVELLDFSAFIEHGNHELSIMFFSMDRDANEVFQEPGKSGFAGSTSVLEEMTYYHVAKEHMGAFDDFYEAHDEILFEQEQHVFGEWFSTCWQEAGGDSVKLPAYFGVHDETEALDLKQRHWVDAEEKWD